MENKRIEIILELVDDHILTADEAIKKIRIIIGQGEQVDKSIVNSKQKHKKITKFKPSEVKYIIKNSGKLRVSQIARDLGRNYQTVWNKLHKLMRNRAVTHKEPKRIKWTSDMDGVIRQELRIGTKQKNIAKKLGISYPSLKHRLRIIRGLE